MKWPTYHPLPSLTPQHFRSLLRAHARQPSFTTGKVFHAVILTTGLSADPNTFVLNTLLHLYGKCGATLYARKLFDQIPHSHKDTADWTSLITCLAHNAVSHDALSLYTEMRKENVEIDEVTMTCLLSLCAQLRDLRVGVEGHACMVKMGFGFSVKTCNAVMDMYGKCGLVDEARQVFSEMEVRSVVSWTVLLDCVVKWEGVEKGRLVFDEMPERNKVTWTVMVVGYVERRFMREGFLLLSEMVFGLGFGLNYVTLCSLLSACAQSGDLMMGRWIHVYALKAMGKEIDIMVGTALVDMANSLRRVLTRKVPGMSSIHVGGQVHQFSSGERSHPRSGEIYVNLDEMIRRLRLGGYIPDTASQVFFGEIEMEEKEQALFVHSEKLALCFGLIGTRPGAPLYIFKNLRICRDCHSAIKIASGIYNREIVVRDRNRFHCFKQGLCSCSDFW
ncbi:hypothetical protein QYF36_001775 [Acer negundo]|nr:hypothetical protein QYF36_001775 [Acer negundo]